MDYLWIDSLCIVQDDREDWEREAAKMGGIFQGAFVTIAAASAPGPNHGCLFDLPLNPSHEFPLPNGIDGSGNGKLYVKRVLADPTTMGRGLANMPIQKRGWILQEMLLSRRVLHCADSQIVWQCHSLVESEDQFTANTIASDWISRSLQKYSGLVTFTKGFTAGGLSAPFTNGDLSYAVTDVPLPNFNFPNQGYGKFTWWMWMMNHSSRSLTFYDDSLPSLAGIAALYCRLTGEEMVGWMPKEDLPLHLSWHSGGATWASSAQDERQPSWSWTVVRPQDRGMILTKNFNQDYIGGFFPSFAHMPFVGSRIDVFWKAHVDEIDISWAGQPMVSQLVSASLTLRRVSWPIPGIGTFMDGAVVRSPSRTDPCCVKILYFDFVGIPVDGAGQLMELLLWVGFKQGQAVIVSFAMLIEPLDMMAEHRGARHYRRVGIVERWWMCDSSKRAMAEAFILERLHVLDKVVIV